MTPMNESLLKTDKIGRLRYTPEQKKTMVDAYFVSGLSRGGQSWEMGSVCKS
jgi:hypothetical protein